MRTMQSACNKSSRIKIAYTNVQRTAMMNDLNEDQLAKIVVKFMLPGPKGKSVKQLQRLLLDVSKKFVDQIDTCKDVEELRELQAYMRYITAEIERKQKPEKK